jgi:hypothetical protein
MDIGKLKTVAIILLAFVNISFAAIIIADHAKTASIRAKERSGLAEALAGLGIEIAAEDIPADTRLYGYSLARDGDAEALIARTLIGGSEAEDLGGNIYLYETSHGLAQFRGSGIFDIIIYPEAVKNGRDMGDDEIISLVAPRAEAEAEGEYVCLYRDLPVFNCRVTVARPETGELHISGCRLPGTPKNETVVEALSPATILLRFVDEITAEGVVIRNIGSMNRGYMLSSAVAGLELRPVWQLLTDGEAYYMDAVSGTLLPDLG